MAAPIAAAIALAAADVTQLRASASVILIGLGPNARTVVTATSMKRENVISVFAMGIRLTVSRRRATGRRQ